MFSRTTSTFYQKQRVCVWRRISLFQQKKGIESMTIATSESFGKVRIPFPKPQESNKSFFSLNKSFEELINFFLDLFFCFEHPFLFFVQWRIVFDLWKNDEIIKSNLVIYLGEYCIDDKYRYYFSKFDFWVTLDP